MVGLSACHPMPKVKSEIPQVAELGLEESQAVVA